MKTKKDISLRRESKNWCVYWPEIKWRPKKKVFAETWSVFSSESLSLRKLVLYSTGLCWSFSSHQPALKSRWGTRKSQWGDAQSRWGDALAWWGTRPPRPPYNLSTEYMQNKKNILVVVNLGSWNEIGSYSPKCLAEASMTINDRKLLPTLE